MLHILILGPLLIAIGRSCPYISHMMIGILGAIIVLYHAYKTYIRMTTGQSGVWINLFHMLLVGPLLLAVAVYDARYLRELVLMTGFAAIGYHAYYAIM